MKIRKNLEKMRLFLVMVLTYSATCMVLPTVTFAAGNAKKVQFEDKIDKAQAEEVSTNWVAAQKADNLRLKTIGSIQQFLTGAINDNKSFELHLRLGELFSERSDYLRAIEIKDWEAKFDLWKKSKLGPEPQLSHDGSNGELLKSSATFHKIVRSFPNHPRIDAALFSLAQSLNELKNPQAESYFLKLLRDYPHSSLAAETNLALGEIYFDGNKIDLARQYYKNASQYRNSGSYTYAVYKYGWANYNSESSSESEQYEYYQKALTSFKLVVRLSDKNKRYKGLDLKREAINDLVMVWAEIEGVEDAFKYFSRMGEIESFYDVLEKLGNTYADQGKNEKAIQSYQRLLSEAKHRERTIETYGKYIGILDLVGQPNQIISSFKNMYNLAYRNGPWLKANAKNAGLIAEEQARVVSSLHRYGALYHKRGQKTNNDAELTTAMRLYQMYLAYFPGGESAYDLRYYLAEIYFHFKMFEPASDEYLRVALMGAKGQYFKSAALASVVAINTVVTEKTFDPLPALGEAKREYQIPREKQKLIKVIDVFVKLLPDDPIGFPMRITAAKILFEHGLFKNGLARFEAIAYEIPTTKEGKVSVQTILNFHTSRSEWQNVIAKSRKYLASKQLNTTDHFETITTHLKNAIFKLAVAYSEHNQHLNAAKTFIAFQREFPFDPNSDKALYNAGQSFFKIDLVDDGLKIHRVLLETYPKSSLVPDVNLSIASTYEGIANYDEAAYFYALFANSYPGDERASAAMFNSATLSKGLKQYELAVQKYNRFIVAYRSHPNVPDAFFEIGTIQESLKNYRESINSFAAYINISVDLPIDRKLYVQSKMAVMKYKFIDANQGFAEIVNLAKFLGDYTDSRATQARRIVAEVMFNNMDNYVAQFKGMKLLSAKTLENDVEAKQNALLQLANTYEQVIAIGSGEFTVASLYRLGEAHELFADDLFNAPDPIASDQLTVDQYRSSIEKVAFPLKEEAFKYYELAYKRSGEVETFSDWTKKSYQKMTSIYPEKHPEIIEQTLQSSYLTHNMSYSDDIDSMK